MTLLEIKTNTRASLDEATAARFTDANIVAWANAAERDICAKTGCHETIQALTTTSGSRLVAFTGIKVNAVELNVAGLTQYLTGGEVNWQDTDDNVWQNTSDNQWADNIENLWIPYPDVSALRITPHRLGHIPLHGETSPKYWFQWGNYIVIEPTPDATYDLNAYVSIYPSDQMSSDADEPEIPKEFQEAIVPYIVMIAKLKDRKYQEAAIRYGEYISTLQSSIDKYIRRRPARVQDIRLPDLVRTR